MSKNMEKIMKNVPLGPDIHLIKMSFVIILHNRIITYKYKYCIVHMARRKWILMFSAQK